MLQETVIAVVAAATIGFLGGTYVGHTTTKKTYELQISQERNAAKDAVILEQNKTLKQERQNENLTTQLDVLAAEYTNQRNKDSTTIRGLLASRDSWVRSPVKCEAPSAGASDSTSGTTSDAAPEGQLSTEFSEYLAEVLRKADEAAAYAEVAHEYAKQISAQRERMMNDGKSTGNNS